MNSNFGRDLTTGSIPKHLLVFAIPMLIGNLLQTGYSIINTIWLGNILGKNAVGASAVSFPIVFILIALASGVTLATTILVSQYYGAKDYDTLKKVISNSFSIAIFLSIILTVIGVISSNYLLKLMGTPIEIFDMASGYLKITILGFAFSYFNFLILSILRGIGDTVTPLKFMAIGVVVNAILDPLLIIGIGPFPKLGLNGAAYASIIAQFSALVLGLIYLNHKNHIVAINFKSFAFDKYLTGLIFKIGLPSVVQQSLISIGAAFVTSFVNAFGSSSIAAFGAAGRIDSIAFMPAMSIGMAVSALTGQNLGANKQERVKEIFKWGVIMTSVITIFLSTLVLSIPRILLSVFVQDQSVLDIGSTYLRIEGWAFIFFGIMFVANGVINGSGHTIITMIISLLSLWVVRVPFASFLSSTSLGIKGIWIAIVLSYIVSMTVSLLYYFSGKWKKPVIKHNT